MTADKHLILDYSDSLEYFKGTSKKQERIIKQEKNPKALKSKGRHDILSAAAFAPGHITGFFEIQDTASDPLARGSRGAGISLARGVTTRVACDPAGTPETVISINNTVRTGTAVSSRVVRLFFQAAKRKPQGRISIEHVIDVPQGAGFGSSGAGALSLALALNAAFGSPLSTTQAAQLAHQAEVELKTGLGTVLADTVGGLEVRVRPGAPGVGEVKAVSVAPDLSVLCFVFGPLSTSLSLSNKKLRGRINASGALLIEQFLKKPEPERFMQCAREFAEKVGVITDRARTILDLLDRSGLVGSMNMFGESVFTLVPAGEMPRLEATILYAKKSGAIIFSSTIAKEGGQLIHEP